MLSKTIHLGISSSALGDDLRAIPQRARELGFAGVQFAAYSSSLHIPELSGSGQREFLRLLSAQDQQLVGLTLDAGKHGFGPPADVDRLLDRASHVLRCSAESGSPLVCVDVGPLPDPPRSNEPEPVISPDELGLLVLPPKASAADPGPQVQPRAVDPAIFGAVDSALAALGSLADRYGVVIAFRSELTSFAALERALRSLNCPWFGLDLDPASILSDEWDDDEVFSRLGGYIRHVRARDAIGGSDRRTKPTVVGVGNVDWASLLANLNAADYHGWITLDPTELADRLGAADSGRKRLLAIAGG